MNKAVLLSIKPKYLVDILNGSKTLELRKSVPKDYVGWVYIYCTKNGHNLIKVKNKYTLEKGKRLNYDLNGKVLARFWFDEYEKISLELVDKSGYDEDKLKEYESENMSNDELQRKLCLDEYEIDNYLNSYSGYAWHIKQLEIFDTPKELSEFYKTNIPYLGRNEIKHAIEYYGKQKVREILKYTVERPPQCWQYVYIEKE